MIDHAQSALSSHRHFIFMLPLFDRITLATLLIIISYGRDPKTRKERALRHPHKRLHPRLRTQQPPELPRNMHTYIARISNYVPRRRARCSKLRVRSWYPAACSSRFVSVAPVPSLDVSVTDTFVPLNSPASCPGSGDLPAAQSLCER